jgi:hypothetical protein
VVSGDDISQPKFSEAGSLIKLKSWEYAMGLEVGGYHDSPDWPKLGPSLLIATCVILAIRTAKWPARFDEKLSHQELDHEIDYAAGLASRVLSRVMAEKGRHFPSEEGALVSAGRRGRAEVGCRFLRTTFSRPAGQYLHLDLRHGCLIS